MLDMNTLNMSVKSVSRPRLAFAASIPMLPTMFRTCAPGLGTIVIFWDKDLMLDRIPVNSPKNPVPSFNGAVSAPNVSGDTYIPVRSPYAPPKTF